MDHLGNGLGICRHVQQPDRHHDLRGGLYLLIIRPDFNIENAGVVRSDPPGRGRVSRVAAFLLIVFGTLRFICFRSGRAKGDHGLLKVFLIPFVLRQDLLDPQLRAFRNHGVLAIGHGDLVGLAPGADHRLLQLRVGDEDRERLSILHADGQGLLGVKGKQADQRPVSGQYRLRIALAHLCQGHVHGILGLEFVLRLERADGGIRFAPARPDELRIREGHGIHRLQEPTDLSIEGCGVCLVGILRFIIVPKIGFPGFLHGFFDIGDKYFRLVRRIYAVGFILRPSQIDIAIPSRQAEDLRDVRQAHKAAAGQTIGIFLPVDFIVEINGVYHAPHGKALRAEGDRFVLLRGVDDLYLVLSEVHRAGHGLRVLVLIADQLDLDRHGHSGLNHLCPIHDPDIEESGQCDPFILRQALLDQCAVALVPGHFADIQRRAGGDPGILGIGHLDAIGVPIRRDDLGLQLFAHHHRIHGEGLGGEGHGGAGLGAAFVRGFNDTVLF